MVESVDQPKQGSTESQLERARELGIDLGLIDENLRLSPLERMRQHDRCERQILTVQECLGVVASDGS